MKKFPGYSDHLSSPYLFSDWPKAYHPELPDSGVVFHFGLSASWSCHWSFMTSGIHASARRSKKITLHVTK